MKKWAVFFSLCIHGILLGIPLHKSTKAPLPTAFSHHALVVRLHPSGQLPSPSKSKKISRPKKEAPQKEQKRKQKKMPTIGQAGSMNGIKPLTPLRPHYPLSARRRGLEGRQHSK